MKHVYVITDTNDLAIMVVPYLDAFVKEKGYESIADDEHAGSLMQNGESVGAWQRVPLYWGNGE